MNLLVFSDDWGRHPSSCQHLISRLLPRMRVDWVNTIGMRPPRLDALTLRRGTEVLRRWTRGSADDSSVPLPPNLQVHSPAMWPWMSGPRSQLLNRRLLTRQLQSIAEDAIAITTLPITADLVGKLPVRRWVYYCVDDFSVWPGLSGRTLAQMEQRLVQRVDRVIAASDTLAANLNPPRAAVDVLTHGVDLDFWACPASGVADVANDGAERTRFAGLTGPKVVFWGVVDRRMHADWVLALAESLASGHVVLIGPQQDPDPRLLQHPRVWLTGPVPYDDLPAIAAASDALIMPYADLPVTRAMQPLKLKEYLATGRPVVASALPAVVPWGDCLQVVESQSQFVDQVHGALQGEADRYRQARQNRLESESWQAKAERFWELVVKGEG